MNIDNDQCHYFNPIALRAKSVNNINFKNIT